MINRLNRISDNSAYASKVSYETFKILGRIYERHYQKDIQEGLDGLEPFLSFIDNVFLNIAKSPGKMNKPIQDMFRLVFAENNLLSSLGYLENTDMENALLDLNSFNFHEISPAKSLLIASHEIQNKEWFKKIDGMPQDKILYALSWAKRKLERQIDWTFCAFDNDLLPIIDKNKDNLIQVSSLLSTSYNTEEYNPENADVGEVFNKHIQKYFEVSQWRSAQHISLLFQNDDKKDHIPYIESRMIPDANELEEVIALPDNLENGQITIENAANVMRVSKRMAKYYLDAAEMLGIFTNSKERYQITEFGTKLARYSDEDKIRIVEHTIKNIPVFKSFLLHLNATNKTRFRIRDIAKFLDERSDLSPKTSERRASTIASWLCTTGILKRKNGKYSFHDEKMQSRILDFLPKR